MGESDHITFRAGDDLKSQLDDLAERYGMKRSQLLRLLLKNSVSDVEKHGLDEFVADDTVDTAEQSA